MVKMNGIKVSKGIKRKITGRLVHAAVPLIIIGQIRRQRSNLASMARTLI